MIRKKKQAVVCIGMPKTGSTALQESLAGYGDGRSFYANLEGVNHSAKFLLMFADKPEESRYAVKRSLSEDVIKRRCLKIELQMNEQFAREDGETIIFCGELICRLSKTEVERMRAYFADRVERVHIVAYYRDPFSYASSAFQEGIKNGKRNLNVPTANFAYRFDKFVEVFGSSNVTLRNFERESLRGGCVIADFCALTGLDVSGISVARVNESLSLLAVKIIYCLNISSQVTTGKPLLHKARKKFVQTVARMVPGEPFRIPSSVIYRWVTPEDIAWYECVSGVKLVGWNNKQDSLNAEEKWFRAMLTEFSVKELETLHSISSELGCAFPASSSAEQLVTALYDRFVSELKYERRMRKLSEYLS